MPTTTLDAPPTTQPRPNLQPTRDVRGLGGWRLALVALALMLPATIPYLVHFAVAPAGRVPTGLIQGDIPIYLAQAREHFDSGAFHWTYGNPNGARYDEPRLYAQTWTLALGTLLHLTGWPPGLAFVAFTAAVGWFATFVAALLFREVVGLQTWSRRLALVVFVWGGGVLELAGVVLRLLLPARVHSIFVLDPTRGWWFLNFGRNLVLPTEALYHALVFLTLLLLIRRRFVAATLAMLATSASTPFTGVELAAVVVAWAAVERFFLRTRAVPGWFLGAAAGVFLLHVGYYLGFLNRFPEHREIAERMHLDFRYQARNFLPAWLLVGALALWSLRRADLAARRLARPGARLILALGVVTFFIANHEFAMTPIQPIHFDRGYIWTALFLLGAGTLVALFEATRARLGRGGGAVALTLLVGLLLSDNLIWLGAFPVAAARGDFAADPGYVAPEALDVLRWLDRHGRPGRDVVVVDDLYLSYLVPTFTPLRSWVAHQYETPAYDARRAEVRRVFEGGPFPPSWSRRDLLLVASDRVDLDRLAPRLQARGAQLLYENPTFRVYRLPARTPAPSTTTIPSPSKTTAEGSGTNVIPSRSGSSTVAIGVRPPV